MKGETILRAYMLAEWQAESIMIGKRYNHKLLQAERLHGELSRRLAAWDLCQQKFPGVAMTCLDVLAERENEAEIALKLAQAQELMQGLAGVDV